VNLFRRWFWPRSTRNEALALYKLGMARTGKKDPMGAMDAYTSAIELPEAPDDVKAMALYNRALLFAAAGETNKALVDLEAVMEMPAPLHDVKLAARRRLERLQHQQDVAARSNRRPTS
jgi:hypothetical protein